MDQRRKVIGVCGSRIFNQIPMQFINALRKAGMERDFYTMAFSSNAYSGEEDDDAIGEEQLFDLTQYIDFSGLVILAETLKNPRLISRIVDIGYRKNIPVFCIGSEVDGCYNVVRGYHDGFEQMVRHVVEEHGCRRVNMIVGIQGDEASDECIDIYKEVLRDNGIPFEEERLAYGNSWERPTRKVMEDFFASGQDLPEAIVCANDAMAITACTVLHEKGYEIPEDVIVTGFDGTRDAEYHFPKISTCKPDCDSAARFILDETERARSTGMVMPCDFMIEFDIDKNQSCGCKPKVLDNVNTVISSLSDDIGDCAWHNIAMDKMVTSLLDKKDIMDIAVHIPEYINLWSDTFRFACVKSDLIHTVDSVDECTRMTTILWDNEGKFEEPGETFSIADFMPGLDEIDKLDGDFDTMIVQLLNSGRKVYGYTVEGMKELDGRHLQRCNEFSRFLSYSINIVLHNYQMNKMNENLTRAYNKISSLYILDPMTGIYNRRGFAQKLDEIISEEENIGKQFYLFSIDMDGLKSINDTYGHGEGDFAITTLSRALSKVGGKGSVCSRFGGDEFACAILDDKPDQYSAREFSAKLMETVQKMSGVASRPYSITASVGMASQRVEIDMSIETMFQAADRLMYADKVARKKQRQ